MGPWPTGIGWYHSPLTHNYPGSLSMIRRGKGRERPAGIEGEQRGVWGAATPYLVPSTRSSGQPHGWRGAWHAQWLPLCIQNLRFWLQENSTSEILTSLHRLSCAVKRLHTRVHEERESFCSLTYRHTKVIRASWALDCKSEGKGSIPIPATY